MWMVEVPLQVGKYHLGLITIVASDSCAVYYALTIRSTMALGKSAGSSSFRMSTDDLTVSCSPCGDACTRVGPHNVPRYLVSMRDCMNWAIIRDVP